MTNCLKPCPFCGSAADIAKYQQGSEMMSHIIFCRIHCTNERCGVSLPEYTCHIQTNGNIDAHREKLAISRWDTRSDSND